MIETSAFAGVEQKQSTSTAGRDRATCTVRADGGLELQLWDPDRGSPVFVSFVCDGHDRGLRIAIGDRAYSAQIESKTSVVPPGEPHEFGVTVLAGTYADESIGGSVLIVVNCGQEPPMLQVAARPACGDVHSSSFEITHDIQQRMLNLFADFR